MSQIAQYKEIYIVMIADFVFTIRLITASNPKIYRAIINFIIKNFLKLTLILLTQNLISFNEISKINVKLCGLFSKYFYCVIEYQTNFWKEEPTVLILMEFVKSRVNTFNYRGKEETRFYPISPNSCIMETYLYSECYELVLQYCLAQLI